MGHIICQCDECLGKRKKANGVYKQDSKSYNKNPGEIVQRHIDAGRQALEIKMMIEQGDFKYCFKDGCDK